MAHFYLSSACEDDIHRAFAIGYWDSRHKAAPSGQVGDTFVLYCSDKCKLPRRGVKWFVMGAITASAVRISEHHDWPSKKHAHTGVFNAQKPYRQRIMFQRAAELESHDTDPVVRVRGFEWLNLVNGRLRADLTAATILSTSSASVVAEAALEGDATNEREVHDYLTEQLASLMELADAIECDAVGLEMHALCDAMSQVAVAIEDAAKTLSR